MSKIPKEHISELDFNEIRKNFLSYVQNNSEFANYDFEASGLNFVVDLLAYNTQYNAFYLNQISSEMYLDTAQKRKNVVSIAKQMGYTPRSKKCAQAEVLLRLTGTENFRGPLPVERYTELIGKDINEDTYPFVVKHRVNVSGGRNWEEPLILLQGSHQREEIVVNNLMLEKKYEIPSRDIDLNTLEVYVKPFRESQEQERFFEAQDITLLNKDSKIYFIEQNYEGKYELVFGDGVLGRAVENNNCIVLEYLVTRGNEGNDCVQFNFKNRKEIPINYLIRTVSPSAAGQAEEDIETIRLSARKSFMSQNRLVTAKDYEIALLRYFNYIDTISVWGGEQNDPPAYGTIFCAIKPKNYPSLMGTQRQEISNKLKELSVVTITPKILDPIYTFIRVKNQIVYNADEITSTEGTIINETKVLLHNYLKNNLLKFEKQFHISDINRLVDKQDDNYVATNTAVVLYQRISLDVGVPSYYEINFNNKIKHGSLKATHFDYLDENNNYIRNCYLKENSSFNGKVDVVTDIMVGTIKETAVIKKDVADINYDTGKFKLETFLPYLSDGKTEFIIDVTPDTFIISPAKEQILAVLEEDIEILPEPFVDRVVNSQTLTKNGMFKSL